MLLHKNVKGKIRPRRAQKGSRGIALLILDLGARRGWVVSTAPRKFYPRERPGTHCTGGWVGPRAGLDVCEKSRPHRDSHKNVTWTIKNFSVSAHSIYATQSKVFLLHFHITISRMSLLLFLTNVINPNFQRRRAHVIFFLKLSIKKQHTCPIQYKYREIRKSLRDFRTLRYSSRYGHTEGGHVNKGRDTPGFCRTLQVLDSSFMLCLLVVAQLSSEVPEGLINYSVYLIPQSF
jgi:hypothetical protein